jgi:hypothetical protein
LEETIGNLDLRFAESLLLQRSHRVPSLRSGLQKT